MITKKTHATGKCLVNDGIDDAFKAETEKPGVILLLSRWHGLKELRRRKLMASRCWYLEIVAAAATATTTAAFGLSGR